MNKELTIKNTENLMIKIDNSLLEQNMHFTAREKDIFMLFCAILKEKGTDLFDVPFRDIKKSIGQKTLSNARLGKIIKEMGNKLLNSTGYITTKSGFKMFVLFTDMEADIDNGMLTISVNPRFSYLLNNLISHYTSAEFDTYLSLNSKYSKDLYFWLLKWKYTGKFIVSENELRTILSIPDTYVYRDIEQRVLKPSIEELAPHFKNLKLRTDRKAGLRGGWAVVERYIFTFTPFPKKEFFEEDVYVCPKCGGNLIMRDMNGRDVYCHKDGAYADAPCHEVYETWEIEDLFEDGKTWIRTVQTDRKLNEC